MSDAESAKDTLEPPYGDLTTNYYTVLKESEENCGRAEKYLRQLEDERHRTEEFDRRTVKAMRDKNWTLADIPKALGRPEKEIEKFL